MNGFSPRGLRSTHALIVLVALAAISLAGIACTAAASGPRYDSISKTAPAISHGAPIKAGRGPLARASRAYSMRARWHPDTTAPDTSITSGPAGPTTATTASFGFSASERNSTFSCRLDGGSWGSCSSPRAYAGLGLGAHTFYVRARDAAGNVDASPAVRSWTVQAPPPPPPPADTTAPETTISSGPSGVTTATEATFSFAANEEATFECKLDDAGWVGCASPVSYANLAGGAHRFSVRATDAAGNVDSTPASGAWTVEAAAPTAGSCDQVVSSISAAQSALATVALGSVVCLADGSYGSLSLSMRRPVPGVTLRAQNPGGATLGGVSASGAGVTVERFNTGSLSVNAGADRIAYDHNSVSGGTYVIGSATAYAKNVDLIGNVLRAASGSGEKDAIMAQRFEGLRVEENEIWIADEDGGHNDGLQTVWGGHGLIFRGNWMRGGAGSQGFFLKDGEVTNVTFEDNLIAGRPSKAPYAGAPLQFYGTVPSPSDPFYTGYGIVIRHNTIWSNPNISYARECQNKALLVEYNVMDGWSAPDGTACVLAELTQDYNVVTSGTIGRRGSHDTAAAPTFANPSSQDWQLTPTSAGSFATGRAGITWQPATRSFGP